MEVGTTSWKMDWAEIYLLDTFLFGTVDRVDNKPRSCCFVSILTTNWQYTRSTCVPSIITELNNRGHRGRVGCPERLHFLLSEEVQPIEIRTARCHPLLIANDSRPAMWLAATWE